MEGKTKSSPEFINGTGATAGKILGDQKIEINQNKPDYIVRTKRTTIKKNINKKKS